MWFPNIESRNLKNYNLKLGLKKPIRNQFVNKKVAQKGYRASMSYHQKMMHKSRVLNRNIKDF